MKLQTEVLERIRVALDKPVGDWADELGLKEIDYRDGLRENTLSVRGRFLLDLADTLKLSPEAIVSGKIDYRTLEISDPTASDALPEIYAHGAFSRRRTSSQLLDFLEVHYGWRMRSQILKHFGLNERIVAVPDGAISIRFLTDLCCYLIDHGFSEDALFKMGQYSVIANYASPLGRKFRESDGPKSLIESTFTEIVNQFFDKNFLYKLIELNDTSCTVEARLNPEASDTSKSGTIGSVLSCKTRGGTFSSLFGYLDLPYAKVTEKTCVHRGDPRCRYEIDFGLAQWCNRKLSAGA